MAPPVFVTDKISNVTSGRYQSSDSNLLHNGLLSDVEVHCMETKRVWKLHKTILCSRSVWFERALKDGWKERQTGVVEIHEISEKHIDLVLNFIYTGSVELEKFFDKQPLWISCMEVWKAADFFCLTSLLKQTSQLRDDFGLHWTKTYAYHVGNMTLDEFPSELIESMVKSISALYQDERVDDPFRRAFKSTLLATAMAGPIVLAKDSRFTSLLRKTPDFALDWSLELTTHIAETSGYDEDNDPLVESECYDCYVHHIDSPNPPRYRNSDGSVLYVNTFGRELTSGYVNLDESFPQTTILVALFRTWKLADCLCIHEFETVLDAALYDALYEMSRVLLALPTSDVEEERQERDEVVRDVLVPGIAALYEDDMDIVRDKVLPKILGLVIAAMHDLQPRVLQEAAPRCP